MIFSENVWMLITDITKMFLTHITDVAYDNKVILITGILITYYSGMLITDFTGTFITGILITEVMLKRL